MSEQSAASTPDFDPLFEVHGRILALQSVVAYMLNMTALTLAGGQRSRQPEALAMLLTGLEDGLPAMAAQVAAVADVPAITAGFNSAVEEMLDTARAAAGARR
ncbi:hypothetical protein [Muricoccus radiodurans]|uniref:hypothetical protein n=1 Tax=Muricoccus radiodurans TaxID=2231721 RepID=UPI003CEE8778